MENVVNKNYEILVVDDDNTARFILGEVLAKQGYKVKLAESGAQAIKNFAENRPSIVLLDIAMPGMNGYEVCQHIRRTTGNNETLIIFISGHDSNDAIKQAFAVGGYDYITKPVNFCLLLIRIETIIDEINNRKSLQYSNECDALLSKSLQNMIKLLVDENGNVLTDFYTTNNNSIFPGVRISSLQDMVPDSTCDKMIAASKKVCETKKSVKFDFISHLTTCSAYHTCEIEAVSEKHVLFIIKDVPELKVNSTEDLLDNNAKSVCKIEYDAISERLRRALWNGDLKLHYQPQKNITSNDIIGAEALLRWNDQELGIISPTKFIPVAESTGLINELGEWVFSEACQQIQNWNQYSDRNYQVGINLSGFQLTDKKLPDRLLAYLNNSGAGHEHIEVELTESVMMSSVQEASTTLSKIKETGVRLAMDDFGTGFSSLSNLSRLPFDTLKIDRSFIQALDTPHGKTMLDAIIKMGSSMNIDIVAEGVETRTQLDYLHNTHCNIVQGYLIARPMPAEQARQFIAREQRDQLMH